MFRNTSAQFFRLHTQADGFHQGMHIYQAGFVGVFLEVLPAPGFEEQAGAQFGQGLVQVPLGFVLGNTLPGTDIAIQFKNSQETE